MKKVLTLLLVAVMLVTCMTVAAFAAEAGDTVSIAFTASNPGAAVFGAQINYDSTALELVSISTGDLTAGGMFSGTASTGKVAYLGMNNITGSGTLFVAEFKVLDEAVPGETYEITATVDTTTTADANGNLVSFSISGGSISIDERVCNHVWGDWTVTTPASCTEEGVETRECSACGETETRAISATGHKFGAWKVTTPATCTEEGEEARECSACGETETRTISATGHKFGAWKVTTPASCTEEGEETRECSACGETETRAISATGHKFGAWKVTTPATCTEEGEEARECSACGETETRKIPVADHALSAYGKDDTHHWLLCDNCDHTGEREPHSYDYNGVCICGATIPVDVDPDLDDVPNTGDIKIYIAVASAVSLFTVAAVAAFVLKRKAAK